MLVKCHSILLFGILVLNEWLKLITEENHWKSWNVPEIYSGYWWFFAFLLFNNLLQINVGFKVNPLHGISVRDSILFNTLLFCTLKVCLFIFCFIEDSPSISNEQSAMSNNVVRFNGNWFFMSFSFCGWKHTDIYTYIIILPPVIFILYFGPTDISSLKDIKLK